LSLISHAPTPLEVEIGGQGRNLEPVGERLALAPGQPATARGDYFSLLYLHAPALPGGALSLHRQGLHENCRIESDDWRNIWIYGLDLRLAGWLTKGEFRRKSRRLRPGSPVRQYRRTQAENWAVPVHSLRPMSKLFEAARTP
jgi:hypothetical protein